MGMPAQSALTKGAHGTPPIGRPFLYGLGVAGADGVERVVTILRQELEIGMALTGRPSLGEVDRSLLW